MKPWNKEEKELVQSVTMVINDKYVTPVDSLDEALDLIRQHLTKNLSKPVDVSINFKLDPFWKGGCQRCHQGIVGLENLKTCPICGFEVHLHKSLAPSETN